MRTSISRAVELGYLTSCNHPRPAGPPWVFKEIVGQHCIEVWNGPWRIFNSEALSFWESRIRRGERIVAVGGSDAHYYKRQDLARIGTPTTWIYCPERPIAANLLAGLRAGHAFISAAPEGPQLYLESEHAMMGDVVARPASGRADVHARVIGGAGLRLELYDASGVCAQADVTADEQEFDLELPVTQTPYLRAQLIELEEKLVQALTNPIYFE
jgi:hypothetical protein